MNMQLLRPHPEHLESYAAALELGWSSNSFAGPEFARRELERMRADPTAFLAATEDREGKGPDITLPDGSTAKRLPGFHRWMWDGEFCGSISFRWQPGTTALPPHCLGHIGFAVVPWKRRNGYATRALELLLPEVWAIGLPFVEITAAPDNFASQCVIETNGGVLVEEFVLPNGYGSTKSLRYRIHCDGADNPSRIM